MDSRAFEQPRQPDRPRLSFTYRLTGRGWAEASLSDGVQETRMRVSYLSDALRDLIEATVALLAGADQVGFVWQDEPGEYHWVITRDREDVEIVITDRGLRDDRQGQPGRFSARCSLRRFSRQILTQVWRIMEEHGPAGYKELWIHHEFPMAQYGRLEQALEG